MTKLIPLTKGRFAIVDDADFDWLSQWKWYTDSDGYAATTKSQRTISMHRMILDVPKGIGVDHKDCNPLNNTRANLRVANAVENARNRQRRSDSKAQYKGITFNVNKWMARIKINGHSIYLGRYSSEESAARAYNAAAILYFGEFAKLNEVPS
jgi:hypothetical protein